MYIHTVSYIMYCGRGDRAAPWVKPHIPTTWASLEHTLSQKRSNEALRESA